MVRAKSRQVMRRGERGAGLVEFALVLPLLMALVLGLVTGGIAYNRKISITNAVREGARYGATLSCSAACVSGGTWISQVKTRVADASGGELATTDVCAWVGQAAGTVDCGQADPAGSAGTMVVKVSATKDAELDVIFFRQTLTLTSKSTARYERSDNYNE
jgi:Flp pilus assembly protein TadG